MLYHIYCTRQPPVTTTKFFTHPLPLYTEGMDKNTDSIDEFIKRYPAEVQEILRKVRTVIQRAAPEAKEKISYGIPTLTLHGNLIHFSAYEHHIGLYPGSVGVAAFQDELDRAGYKTAKGTIQFPLDQPIPYELIERITRYCVEQRLR